MQPNKSDQYKPRWKHYHPQSTVWVQNPFDYDIVYQVADEHNIPYTYRLPANKISELPGGAIATLGVKEIIDTLIQNDKKDQLRIWDEEIRTKYEQQVIVRVKEAPVNISQSSPAGEIDLSVKTSDIDEEPVEVPEEPKEEQFASLKAKHNRPTTVQVSEHVALPTEDQLVESD